MVGTIAPVVYRNSPLGRKGWIVAAAIYTGGSIVGGGTVGGALGSFGGLFSVGSLTSHLPLLIGLPAIAYSLHELGIIALPFPEIRRQVPEHWRRFLHPYVTAGLFGLLLGAGFTTFISTATYYIVVLIAVLHGSPLYGAFILSIYGLARAVLLWPFSKQATSLGIAERITYYMDLTKPIMHQVNGFALALLGAYLLRVYLSNVL